MGGVSSCRDMYTEKKALAPLLGGGGAPRRVGGGVEGTGRGGVRGKAVQV